MRSTRTPADPGAPTRERLLRAAARAIADHGFRGATVRDICRRAGANVAAVSYHFGSKERLTVEAVRWAASCMPGESALTAIPTGESAADLEIAVRSFARRILTASEGWQSRLMLRVMSEPNPVLDVVVREVLEPRVRALESALRPYLPGATDRRIRLTALSVVAQFAHHRLASPVTLRLLGERTLSPVLADEIADHVLWLTRSALGIAPDQKEPRR